MANPTSAFGWQMPTSTDLVTDLPADFEVFGQAVDTSLADLKGGTTGQVLSKATNADMDFTWVTTDDANAIQNSIVDAKGDLIAASANDTPARLAVGNNGETLVADSSTSTGLRYTANFAAGLNKVINGDFSVNQRNFTSTVNDNTFTFDRWRTYSSGTDQTYSAQTFTPGAAPVAGYEGQSFAQIATIGAAGKFAIYSYRIEDVRTFAGQTMTVSFWAKANSGTPKISLAPAQFFGTGGSATVTPTAQIVTISTSWTRYSLTFSMPSLSGKTIGTGSYLALEWTFNNDYNVNIGQQTNTFQFWGVKAEAGSVATAFQTATGTIQGELAACQRYFRTVNYGALGACISTTAVQLNVYHPSMRTAPTVATPAVVQISDMISSNYTQSSVSVFGIAATTEGIWFSLGNFTGLTSGRPATLNSSTGITLSAEL